MVQIREIPDELASSPNGEHEFVPVGFQVRDLDQAMGQREYETPFVPLPYEDLASGVLPG